LTITQEEKKMTETKVNYDDETTTKIVEAYKIGESDDQRKAILETLSAETGKTVKSLRAKLVREGVYVKQTYKTKTGAKAETKETIVESIAVLMDVTAEQLGGLEKATKPALLRIRKQFRGAYAALAGEDEAGEEAAE